MNGLLPLPNPCPPLLHLLLLPLPPPQAHLQPLEDEWVRAKDPLRRDGHLLARNRFINGQFSRRRRAAPALQSLRRRPCQEFTHHNNPPSNSNCNLRYLLYYIFRFFLFLTLRKDGQYKIY